MNRELVVLSLCALLITSTTYAQKPKDKYQFNQLIDRSMKHWDVPGSSVIVVSRSDLLHLQGYGVRDVKSSKPCTTNTVFPIASCSKSFTSALIATLVGEKKMKWDDHVRDHLSYFKLSDPEADEKVTIRDVLTHRTGLAPNDLMWYRSNWTMEELVRRSAYLPLTKPFRSELQYQSVMYVAAGLAAEKIEKQSWEEQLKTRFFRPLGMNSTSCVTPSSEDAEIAMGYRADRDGKLQPVNPYVMTIPNPAGSVHSTARDLGHWLQLYLNGGKVNNKQLIDKEALEETQKIQIEIPLQGAAQILNPETKKIGYGMGWVIQDYRDHPIAQHTGLIDGFRIHLTLLPKDGYGIAILANREGTRMNLALSNNIVDRLLELPPIDWNGKLKTIIDEEEEARKIRLRREEIDRIKDTVPTVKFEELVGEYDNPSYGIAKVNRDGNNLRWKWGPWDLKLDHFQFDNFRVVSDHPELDHQFFRFAIKDGKVLGFTMMGVNFYKK